MSIGSKQSKTTVLPKLIFIQNLVCRQQSVCGTLYSISDYKFKRDKFPINVYLIIFLQINARDCTDSFHQTGCTAGAPTVLSSLLEEIWFTSTSWLQMLLLGIRLNFGTHSKIRTRGLYILDQDAFQFLKPIVLFFTFYIGELVAYNQSNKHFNLKWCTKI